MRKLPGILVATMMSLAMPAAAEVVRVEVTTRATLGRSGYEKIVGTVHFAIDPLNTHNTAIADIDKARTNANQKVEFSADLYILRPTDAARSNGVALVEVANRGNKLALGLFNDADGRDPATEADLGDGFLTRQGYTLVWVGWQFDASRQGGRVKLDAPIAAAVRAIVRARVTVNQPGTEASFADLTGYGLDASDPDATLVVRDDTFGTPQPIARDRWTLRGHSVVLKDGFEAGRDYELAVRAIDPPIAGVGLAAVRDVASWLKYRSDALASVKYAYGFGVSQSGRFLRSFLYGGFNSDENGRQVFDGVLAHIAGGARLSVNERGAVPNSGKAPTPAFPFADAAMRDPVTGRVDGLLDNDRARANQPKVFYTNTSVEYWSADRSAALMHTTPDGTKDIALPANVRTYFFAGTQHSPASFPPATSTGQQAANPLEYVWTMRALLMAMDRWVKDGSSPPASQHPRLDDGTLVKASEIRFPAIPGVQSPHLVRGNRDPSREWPFLVPAVDQDGNERAGIRTAEHAVPVATYTGWNFRNEKVGGTRRLVNLMGSAIAFPKTIADRQAAKDGRRSIAERYQSKDEYLALAAAHCRKLVEARYLLEEDVASVMKRVAAQWEVSARPPSP